MTRLKLEELTSGVGALEMSQPPSTNARVRRTGMLCNGGRPRPKHDHSVTPYRVRNGRDGLTNSLEAFMRITFSVIVTTSMLVAAALLHAGTSGQDRQTEGHRTTLAIPQSIQAEHKAIHNALTEATTAPGRVGVAARELAAVLGPHFKREDEIALPPLGLLAPLAAGEMPAGMKEALAMTDALRKELPRMLEEHKHIRAATEKLRAVAREENAPEQEQFAEELAAHATSEEEVLYPAAILVGDIIRARMAK